MEFLTSILLALSSKLLTLNKLLKWTFQQFNWQMNCLYKTWKLFFFIKYYTQIVMVYIVIFCITGVHLQQQQQHSISIIENQASISIAIKGFQISFYERCRCSSHWSRIVFAMHVHLFPFSVISLINKRNK